MLLPSKPVAPVTKTNIAVPVILLRRADVAGHDSVSAASFATCKPASRRLTICTLLGLNRLGRAASNAIFLEFPWRLYDRDRNWIPPLWRNQAELTGIAPHPFYERNKVALFLAYRGAHVVGRVAAIVNHSHNELHEPRGFVGFFECEDCQETANGLFDAARDWLANQGLRTLRGPANPSMNYECGLLVDGFDSSPHVS